MTELIRQCPKCRSQRLPNELRCENVVDDTRCDWPLFDQPLVNPSSIEDIAPTSQSSAVTVRRCLQGHEVASGDIVCFVCGSEIIDAPGDLNPEAPSAIEPEIDGWSVDRQIFQESESEDYFELSRQSDQSKGFLVLYKENYEPDPAIYTVMKRMDQDHLPTLISTGRWRRRPYELHEWINCGSLQELDYVGSENTQALRDIVHEIAKALRDFADVGLRHRDINPRTILVRERDPLDLVVTEFGSARLSDFDLDVISPLTLTRYSAPEAIVGAISAASDWWSLGMIVLEQVTDGRCFADINEKAFLIHVVTRGVELPSDLSSKVLTLLRGLLAKDPLKRWQWREVDRWLQGEQVEAPDEFDFQGVPLRVPIRLSEADEYSSPERFALAAAEAENWESALHLYQSGELATWLNEYQYDSHKLALINRLSNRGNIELSYRLALTLMVLNEALPFTQEGTIVTPGWLLEHPEPAFGLVFGEVPAILEEISRESWLVNLKYRGHKVADRAKMLEIELDDFLYRQYIIVTSRAKLDVEENILREAYPDSDHAGLNSLMHRNRLGEVDLLVLLCAQRDQLITLSTVVEQAGELASKHQIDSFDERQAIELLRVHRKSLLEIMDDRLQGFARCGIEKIDDWADTYRIERRLSLQRILLLLSVDPELWVPPERQKYKENIIRFFEKRVVNSVLRGPLVRLTVGKNSSRIDLSELSPDIKEAGELVNFVLDRSVAVKNIDPQVFSENLILEQRFRRLINQTVAYRRDTGIDTMYLGFPFLLMRDSTADRRRPRIAPLLLWPVSLGMENARSGNFSLRFDKEREEIRLNPALEGLLGSREFEKYKAKRNELLARTTLRLNDVMEVLNDSAEDYQLRQHPSTSLDVPPGHLEVVASAVIFNAKFVGQAISEDLRQLRQIPIENTALEVLLKAEEQSQDQPDNASTDKAFNVVRSDPSQDIAIRDSRKNPGLVIEGPPGTGKSQTIVNIVADCIGRGESVLIVCQKQAALNVVRKRLAAENLEQRICGVVDINRDRQSVIKLIREQIESLFGLDTLIPQDYKGLRLECIRKIDMLEDKVNGFEVAIRSADERYGESYREVICRLIEIQESTDFIVDVPELRSILEPLDNETLFSLQHECASLADDWVDAGFEDSPYHGLKQFSVDSAVLGSLQSGLEQTLKLEVRRKLALSNYPADFDDPDASTYEAWIKSSKNLFESLSAEDHARVTNWSKLFFDGNFRQVELGQEIYAEAVSVNQALEDLDARCHDSTFFEPLRQMEPDELAKMGKYCESFLAAKSSFTFLNLLRIYRTRKLKSFVQGTEGLFQPERVTNLRAAVNLEFKLRPLKLKLSSLLNNLDIEGTGLESSNLAGLKIKTADACRRLEKVVAIAGLVNQCPRREDAINVFNHSSPQASQTFFDKMAGAVMRAAHRATSKKGISELGDWFTDQWIQERQREIAMNQPLTDLLAELLDKIGTIRAFQSFRVRTAEADSLLFNVFAQMRQYESNLRTAKSLGNCVAMTIKHEAAHARKNDIERRNPNILMGKKDLDILIADLQTACEELLTANKNVLSNDVKQQGLGGSQEWESITRLRGPRTKKLREFLSLGNDLGLMNIRPVWLMNPEVVSQVLPLKAGLFDVVIFDEASQLLVDHSLPSLFRAKRVVISGDEKQMPPNSAFSRKMDADDDDFPEELDEDMSEAEIASIEERWNQREIKDCPDLLALGRSALPSTTLQIHYRSEYNALIEFSNFAFYSGRLNVPAKHPESEIKKVKPVEVRPVNGTYIDQTNPQEAEAIIEFLKEIWTSDGLPPSIGVVTFNLKQAELIEGLIQMEASTDQAFEASYAKESERMQEGEDMGFFVKNVENVQGDERDCILFSTTFGFNQHGSFRRNFGALGHRGGEKRLNVAVTRARKKVVIFTSMPIGKISDGLSMGRKPNKPRDYLQAYLDYASKKSGGEIRLARRMAEQLSQAVENRLPENKVEEDSFVRSVRNAIEEFGFTAVAVNERDAFGLDLAIENPATGLFELAIECDAPYHELLHTAQAREIWRKSVLRRSIANIHRINCLSWYQNREQEKRLLGEIINKTLRQDSASGVAS